MKLKFICFIVFLFFFTNIYSQGTTDKPAVAKDSSKTQISSIDTSSQNQTNKPVTDTSTHVQINTVKPPVVADTTKTKQKPVNDKASKSKAVESRIRLAALNFTALNIDEIKVSALSDTVRKLYSDVGLYKVQTREEMNDILKALNKKMPQKCDDELSILKIGKLLNVSKSIGGEISKDGDNYAVKMIVMDVNSNKAEGRVWLASKCKPDEINKLIQAVIIKLHKQKQESLSIKIRDYKGPEFSKRNMWVITAGATLISGIAYAMIDGGLTGRDNNSAEYISGIKQEDDISLSGIPGAFIDLGYGARAHAMGRAYVAVSNDVSGILWNPAGLAKIKKSELTASYLKTIYNVPYLNAGYVGRFSRTGSYGAMLLSSGDNVYGENEFISSCAKLFDDVNPNLRPFSCGMNLKLRTSSTGSEGTGLGRITANSFGIGIDAGLQFELSDNIDMGFVAKDIFSAQRWHNTYLNSNYSEDVPTILVLGGAFEASPSLLLTMDGYIPAYSDQAYKIGMGIEKVIFDILALRAGIFQNLDFMENRRITCGLGLIFNNFGCDASYELAEEKVFQGNLRISTSLKF